MNDASSSLLFDFFINVVVSYSKPISLHASYNSPTSKAIFVKIRFGFLIKLAKFRFLYELNRLIYKL